MPRLLLMTSDFPPRQGGVARYLDTLAGYFKEDILVIAPPEQGSDAFDQAIDYQVERQKLFGKHLWPKWLPALDLLMKRKDDFDYLLVSHVLPFGTAALITKTWTKKPYIVFVHGMDIALAKRSAWKRWLAKKVLRGAKVVVANSSFLAEEVKNDFGVNYTITCYPPLTLKASTSSTGNLAFPEPVAGAKQATLLTVSRLVPRKGHLRVLGALAQLRDQDELPDLKYRIIGRGPMKELIQERISELDLDDVVSLETEVDDEALQHAYAQADVFVMPIVADSLDREGFGMVYLEAAQHGVPSIATKMPGVDEAVLHEKTGWLVEDDNRDKLTEAIKTLVTDQDLRQSLGAQARNRAKNFTAEASFAKLRGWV